MCDFAYKAAEEGKHYAYKVVAINAAGESEESEIFDFGLLPEEKADDGQQSDADNDMQDNKADNAKNGGISPVVIVAIVVAAVTVVAAVIIIKKKNKN